MSRLADVVERLIALGFTQYEAQSYAGLVGQQPMTGYALAQLTKIPQPKVYETLRRLEDKHAVVRIGDDPARFVAVPTDHLLAQLQTDFDRRIADAKLSLAQMRRDDDSTDLRVFRSLSGRERAVQTAVEMIESSTRHVYMSLHSDQLDDIAGAATLADDRGVRIDMLLFGDAEIVLRNGAVVRHASTKGTIYRHHQARHIAAVTDTGDALWALAADGDDWNAINGQDPLLASVVKGYIRHDLYVQRIYHDFPAELESRYGPGLADLVAAMAPQPAGKQPAYRKRRRKTG